MGDVNVMVKFIEGTIKSSLINLSDYR